MPILSLGNRVGPGGRFALLAALGGLFGREAAAQRPGTAYRAGWEDVATIALLTSLAVAPGAAGLPNGAPDCAPCDPTGLPAIDRRVPGAGSAGAGTASDLVLLGVAAGAAVATIAAVPAEFRTGNAAVLGETITAAYAVTGWMKVAVARERPVMYTSDAAAAADDPDSQRSFPSGHTAAAFAVATSYLVVSGRQQAPHRTRNALLLFAGAVAVGALRVAAGRHFPTDVLGGAIVGAAIGWAVPTLRR
jgi:membrane-associated phospholipid phosphatase